MAQTPTGTTARRSGTRRGHKGLITLAILALLIVLLTLIWSWDWFIPIVDSQASATLGRKVTIQHLHVRLGSTVRVVADDVSVAGTDAFPKPLATVQHLTVGLELPPLIRHFAIVVPLIDVDHPVVDASSDRTGANNWSLGSGQGKSSAGGAGPKLGVLRIEDGHVHVEDAKLRANFAVTVSTRNTPDPDQRPLPSDQGQIVAEAKGTYAGQPITGHFIGGAVLSLRDKQRPYPIDLNVANGPTHVRLVGTIEQPLSFGGARLKLLFAGPDMSLLFPLTAVPIPQTPPYRVEGNLDYTRDHIEFRDFHGRVGSSDLNGTIAVVPSKVPTIDANLYSHSVNLVDLGGFIGSTPGKETTAGTAAQKTAIAHANSSGDVLPTNTFNVPKINAATVHLSYKGDHIENPDVPLDNIVAKLNIENGDIDLKQLDFAVGSGTIVSGASLQPTGKGFRTRAHLAVHNVDLSRVMQATHAFHGKGIIGGRIELATAGNSIATMVGNGDGRLQLVMSGGGNVSALLPDIAGLEFGNALLSALGVPNRATIQCFVLDMPLKDGIMSTDAFLLQTSEARTVGRGTVDFRNQTLDYSLTTRSTRFSIGSLPGPINLTGKLGKPSILPGTEVVARTAGAVALGIVFPPAALIPLIQFGVGKGSACETATAELDSHTTAAPAASTQRGRNGRTR